MKSEKLKACLEKERRLNLGSGDFVHTVGKAVCHESSWLRWRFVKAMRLSEEGKGIAKYWYLRRKNILGNKLGFEIWGTNIGEGLQLFHNGPIVINKDAVIGKNCSLHGDNCIGNDGMTLDCPRIGDDVNIGVGAKIIGGIEIADGCVIGAGAVVVESVFEPNSIVVGIPGRAVKQKISEPLK